MMLAKGRTKRWIEYSASAMNSAEVPTDRSRAWVVPKNSPKKLADEMDAKHKDMGFRQVRIKQLRKKFLKGLAELRSGPIFLELDENGKPVLSINGKAGMSVDLLIATCQ